MTGDGDNPLILGVELLYRRVSNRGDTNMLSLDEGTGRMRVKSGAFVWDDDGCSVYRDSVLLLKGMGPVHVKRETHHVVLRVSAQDVRDVSLGVKSDPWPVDGDTHARQAAHALLVNCLPIGKRAVQRARSALARKALILSV